MRDYLKEARLSLGMTQEDVAKHIGISANYYCSIEKGERQRDMNASILIALVDFESRVLSQILQQHTAVPAEHRKDQKIRLH